MKRLILALVCALPLAAASDDSFLIRGVTVHPVSGPEIAKGAVLVRDGKIVEVGANVSAPKGVRIIEGKGLHVYPGMIDSATELGLSEIGSVRETNDSMEIGDFNPQVRAVVAINPASEHIPVTRANGITSAIAMPSGTLVCGQSALIHLDGWTWEQMAIEPDACLNLRFPAIQTATSRYSSRGPRAPYAEAKRAYEKRMQQLDEFFEAARRYQRAKAARPAGFRTDVKYEAMLPVLERKLPLVIQASRERAIREAIKFADKQQLRVVLAGVEEGDKVAADLKAKNIPVIVGPTLALPLFEDDSYDRPYSLPAALHRAGVKFAFGTFSTSFSRNLPYQAAMAVAFGLPQDVALKSVTLNAAEIWGVNDRIGSIEKGKWADLMMTDGDPLETRTQIKQLFIKGKQVSLENKHHLLYEKYLARQ